MASIDLPRALQDYFAFAETTPTRNGRRFSITLPYRGPDGRLERLQWWYHLSPAKEKALGELALTALRNEAIERFRVHIERWLQNTAQELHADGAIPQVSPVGARVSATSPAESLVALTPPPDAQMDGSDDAGDESIRPAASKTAFG
ncbi:MAG TPA: hypothetical protein VMT29_20290 [Steroidobacteraceae bacterium]|nr:hypothetical protein [Steroidobacteraceae bacterium]